MTKETALLIDALSTLANSAFLPAITAVKLSPRISPAKTVVNSREITIAVCALIAAEAREREAFTKRMSRSISRTKIITQPFFR